MHGHVVCHYLAHASGVRSIISDCACMHVPDIMYLHDGVSNHLSIVVPGCFSNLRFCIVLET